MTTACPFPHHTAERPLPPTESFSKNHLLLLCRKITRRILSAIHHAKIDNSPSSANADFSENGALRTPHSSKPSSLILPRTILGFLLVAALSGIGNAQVSVDVNWKAHPATNVGGYKVYLGTSSGNYSSIKDVAKTTTTRLNSLAVSTTYYCAVQVYNTAGITSGLSPEAVFTTDVSPVFPEITVQDSSGSNMVHDDAELTFPSTNQDSSSAWQTIRVINTGSANLTGLTLSIEGGNRTNFSFTALKTTTLTPGSSTTVDVRFNPTSTGALSSTLKIGSNDADENPFFIALSGTGNTRPEIQVEDSNGNPLNSGSSNISFGSLVINAGSTTRNITIRNTGNRNLTGISLSLTGSQSSNFTFTAPGSTLTPGASTTVTLSFNPSATGTRSANLRILSNDSTNSPFDITLSGTGLQTPPPQSPEIAIRRANGSNLTNGSSSITFGTITLGSTSPTESITISNTGNVNLTGLQVLLTGGNASNFSVTALKATTLTPDASTTVSISFTPSSTGAKSSTLQILSNDADENPFEISLSGTGGSTPVVFNPAIYITDASDSQIRNDDTASFGSITLGSTSAKQYFTIHNRGNAELTGLQLSTWGWRRGDYKVSSLGINRLAPGARATFSITFEPSKTGSRNADLRIYSNDPDTPTSSINLSGTGINSPEIQVEDSTGTPLSDGSSNITFPSRNLNAGSTSKTITIRNTGNRNLTDIKLSLTGSHPDEFTFTSPNSTLAPGASTTVTLSFNPSAAGTRASNLRILSNDADESPFDIALFGNGLLPIPVQVPEITVERSNGSNLISGTTPITFGKIPLKSFSAYQSITIKNTGTANLTGIKPSITGSHAANYSLNAPIPRTLSPGKSTSFSIVFKPQATGKGEAILKIRSNDADEQEFQIPLVGTGIKAPSIKVAIKKKNPFIDDESIVSFATTTLGKRGKTKTFTIKNSGSKTLKNLKLRKRGAHRSDFIFSKLKRKSLAPGKSITFKVTFKPTVTGTRQASIRLLSNDPESAKFDIALTGKSALTLKSTVTIDGKKYRCITISKSGEASIKARSVQVSSNRIDWFSRKKHTTVIKNNASFLKVRDKTPFDPAHKRFIRIKP